MLRFRGDKRSMLGAIALFQFVLSVPVAVAEESTFVPRDNFGELGIIDMPSAYMGKDGEISLTASLLKQTQRVNFSFQVLPWLEGTFRYSHLSQFGTTGNYYDRSFGMRVRFWEESKYLPAVSMGIRDILGTGVYGSEYFVASKRIGSVDLSGGLGWGRMSDNGTFENPFGLIFPSFKVRPPFSGTGGQVEFNQFFHGPKTGAFGGFVWHTPFRNLDFLAEYSSDEYKHEVATGNMSWRAPVNVGLAYRPFEAMQISASWMYATTWGAAVSFATDPTTPLFPGKIGASPPVPTIRDARQQIEFFPLLAVPDPHADLRQALMSEAPRVRGVLVEDDNAVIDLRMRRGEIPQCSPYAQIVRESEPSLHNAVLVVNGDTEAICGISHETTRVHYPEDSTAHLQSAKTAVGADARKQGLIVEAISIGLRDVVVYYQNRRYYSQPEAAGRLARILMADMPPSVESFRMIVDVHGVPVRQFYLLRSDLERILKERGSAEGLPADVTTSWAPLSHPVLDSEASANFPRVSWSIVPRIHQSFFDPNEAYQVQFLATGTVTVDLWPGLVADSKLDGNIWNNFDTNRVSNSQLPHVRSDIAQYLKHGASGISDLKLSYRARIAPTVFTELKAGYLEDMFAGAGGQVLWRPESSRLSLGADLYQVWQRGFDRLFDLRDYHTLTGHVSLYYEMPWYGLNLNIHAGRYLAGDYGGTFELVRRFSTGVEIGAFATFTNVPFSKFGEGSFDKGIILRVPLEWALPVHSTNVFDGTVRSLSRDGGQRLLADDSLHDETLTMTDSAISERLDDLVNPQS